MSDRDGTRNGELRKIPKGRGIEMKRVRAKRKYKGRGVREIENAAVETRYKA